MKLQYETMLKENYASKSEASRLNNELIETRRKVERSEALTKKLQQVEQTLKDQNQSANKRLEKAEARLEEKLREIAAMKEVLGQVSQIFQSN